MILKVSNLLVPLDAQTRQQNILTAVGMAVLSLVVGLVLVYIYSKPLPLLVKD